MPDDKEDTIAYIREGSLDDSEIHNWAGNNMNWSYVSAYAVIQPAKHTKVDFQDGWLNGGKEIIGDL